MSSETTDRGCSCADWAANIDKINGPILSEFARGRGHGYIGKVFQFCPWCAQPLDGERSREALNHLLNKYENAVVRGEEQARNDLRVTILAHLDASYAEEVQRVSQLLTDAEPNHGFASISAHVTDLLGRRASSSSSAAPSPAQPSGGTLSEVAGLRRLLFLSHPCLAKYGDDGEMFCGACRIDFKRDSAEHIDLKLLARGMKLLDAARSHPGEQAAPRAFCGSVMRDTTPAAAPSSAGDESGRDKADAARWRYFRQFLSVEDDYQEGGQYLDFWDSRLDSVVVVPGFDHTIESLVDSCIARDAAPTGATESDEQLWRHLRAAPTGATESDEQLWRHLRAAPTGATESAE